jgi:DNA-binding transcriptional LysR family regulator
MVTCIQKRSSTVLRTPALHMVKGDLDNGALVKIRVEGMPPAPAMLMSVVFRKDAPPGPAGRAFISQLKRK